MVINYAANSASDAKYSQRVWRLSEKNHHQIIHGTVGSVGSVRASSVLAVPVRFVATLQNMVQLIGNIHD